MTFYVRDLNDFMTVQDFLFLLLLRIQDFWVVRVRFIQSVSALRAFRRGSVQYVFQFSRYTSRRSSYWSAQLSNCAGSGLLYIKYRHMT